MIQIALRGSKSALY